MVYLYSIPGRLALYLYLAWRGGNAWPQPYRKAFYGLMGVEFILFSIAQLTHRLIQTPVMSAVMTSGIFLFFALGYGTMFVMLLDVLRWLDARRWRLYADLSPRFRLWVRRSLFILIPILMGLSMWRGYHNVWDLRVQHYQLSLSGHTPPGEQERHHLRVAFLSDIHIGEGITPPFIEQAVDSTLAQHPDLILIGGDYIDHLAEYAESPEVETIMRRLQAPLGVYYTLGNHEYRADTLRNIEWVSKVGATLLRDSIIYPCDSLIALIGADDFINPLRKGIGRLGEELSPGNRPTIYFAHTPDPIDSITATPIDLALYGHTHGGQVWPMHLLVWLKYGITSGFRYSGDVTSYVSSGVGAAGAPFRIGSRSEISIFDLSW